MAKESVQLVRQPEGCYAHQMIDSLQLTDIYQEEQSHQMKISLISRAGDNSNLQHAFMSCVSEDAIGRIESASTAYEPWELAGQTFRMRNLCSDKASVFEETVFVTFKEKRRHATGAGALPHAFAIESSPRGSWRSNTIKMVLRGCHDGCDQHCNSIKLNIILVFEKTN